MVTPSQLGVPPTPEGGGRAGAGAYAVKTESAAQVITGGLSRKVIKKIISGDMPKI